MVPNMEAMERSVRSIGVPPCHIINSFFRRPDDVEMKLVDTEKEADKARNSHEIISMMLK